MTLGDVVDAQKAWSKNHGSSAAGRYQFMRATLQDLSRELGLRGNQLFDADLQDRLGYHLLKRRGYEDFMAGRIGVVEFGRRLAMEWASLPMLAATKGAHRQVPRGSSFYMGDKLNKSLVTPERVEAMLARVKAAGTVFSHEPAVHDTQADLPIAVEPQQAEPVTSSKRFWTWLTTGGGTAVLPFVDWRVQFLIVLVVVGFAIYAIATMPAVRKKLGLA